MDTVEEKFAFFTEMVHSLSPVRFWEYDANIRPIMPEEEIGNDMLEIFFRFGSADRKIRQYIADGGRLPTILDDSAGLMWTCVLRYEGGRLERIYVMGPSFYNHSSKKSLLARIMSQELDISGRRKLREACEEIPVLTSSQIFSFTVMMHRCVTGENIISSDIQFVSSRGERREKEPGYPLAADNAGGELSEQKLDNAHLGAREVEMKLMEDVRTGNLNFADDISETGISSSGVRVRSDDFLRMAKDSVILFTGLASRAAMDGGLDAATAYSLCDLYVSMVEGGQNMHQIADTSHQMMEDYVRRVHNCRSSRFSSDVRKCCDYMEVHCREEVNLDKLAELTGCTKYYISRKFRDEVGETPGIYLRKVRIGRAKELLSGTTLSVGEIAEQLRFNTASRFTSQFHEITGVTPTQWREGRR